MMLASAKKFVVKDENPTRLRVLELSSRGVDDYSEQGHGTSLSKRTGTYGSDDFFPKEFYDESVCG